MRQGETETHSASRGHDDSSPVSLEDGLSGIACSGLGDPVKPSRKQKEGSPSALVERDASSEKTDETCRKGDEPVLEERSIVGSRVGFRLDGQGGEHLGGEGQ